MAELDTSKLMSVREAIDLIDRTEVRPRIVRAPLTEADGMRLAADVAADRDYPPFAKSLMDGYAVRVADVAPRGGPASVTLTLAGEIAAGAEANRSLQAGEAIAIMTGAPLPAGADGVVPIEDTERTSENAVRILRPGQPARYVAAKGSDVAKGTVVLKRGVAIGPQQAAVLATIGAWQVDVFDRPRVAVLSTGDELAGESEEPGPAQIRNSNGPMLIPLLRRLGCTVTDLGICRDNPDALKAKLTEGLSHDALFVSGGMSMGEYDYVPRLLVELGVELKVTKLRIKPGKPFVFGVGNQFAGREPGTESREKESARSESGVEDGSSPSPDSRPSGFGPPSSDLGPAYVFGLPGNPVSAFVCTIRLASRLLNRLAGGDVIERWQTGRLEVGMVPNGPREFYQPVIRTSVAARNSSQSVIAGIRPLTWKGSADLFTLAAANGLLVRAENEPALPMGTVVRVLEI